MLQPAISQDDFERFREYFYRKTGIQFDASKRYFVDKRLLERMEVNASHDFREYFTMMRYQASGTELQTLINSMTVNETYFFREEYQFQCLVRSILPEIVAGRREGPIRIWVVPSSSGEEAYSVAIYLLERWADIHSRDVEIVSSDIDTAILELARAGLYSARSVQQLPAAYLRKYFHQTSAGYQLDDELRSSVDFTRVNLCDPADVRPYRDFDVVFCRNLLIYFDDVSRKQAAEALYDTLRPGGFILLGHSESMSRISPLFRIRRFAEAIVYQKAAAGDEP